MRRLFLAAAGLAWMAMAVPAPVSAQADALHFDPAPSQTRPGEIALDTPRATDVPSESWLRQSGYLQVRNVSRATLLPFLPLAHKATGDAVIVAPGGGFLGLAIENEGWAVAQALADHGIAAFVLKYRVLPTPASFDAFRDGLLALRAGPSAGGKKPAFSMPADTPPRALEDGLAALRFVRSHAASYGVDPARVGMMGFSAGAFLTLTAATTLSPSDRPAFIAPIYPTLAARAVPADAPPMFVAMARDDFLFDPGLGLIRSWVAASRPTEFHLYQAGGHGFGLGNPATTTDGWFAAFLRWREYNRTLPSLASGARP